MFGGLAIRKSLLCHGYSDTVGRIRLLHLPSGEVKGSWHFGGGEGWADVGGLCLDRDANLYVADPEGGRIRRFSLFGTPAGEVGGNGEAQRGSLDHRGLVVHPNDVALDDLGNLYVAGGEQPGRHAVQSFTPAGEFRFACRAFGEPLEEWGIPMGITVARDLLFVADTFNHCVQVFGLDGSFRMMFSTAEGEGSISQPVALTVNREGDVLVAQWRDRPAVLAFDREGWFKGELVGPGRREGRVEGPAALALDEEENLYVLDQGGERVQQFDSRGVLVRVVCRPGETLSGE